MNEISQLIKTLKRRLKIQGMTYRELAAALNLSEASVKRLFASERFTLERIVEIANLLGFTLAELAAEAAVSENRLHTLSEEQEKELVQSALEFNDTTVEDILTPRVNMVAIAGGKYTTYRVMAEDAVDAAAEFIPTRVAPSITVCHAW